MAKHRLMIVEDDPNIAELVGLVGQDIGFTVQSVANFTQIEKIYDSFSPHLIVLDIIMPDMDGFEVLHMLHRRQSSSRVLILSGQAGYRPMASKMADSLSILIVGAIPKPFRIVELRQRLEDIKLDLPDPVAPASFVEMRGSA